MGDDLGTPFDKSKSHRATLTTNNRLHYTLCFCYKKDVTSHYSKGLIWQLAQEISELTTANPITINTGSSSSSVASLGAMGYCYMWWKEFDESLQQHPLASEVYMLVNYTAEVCFAFVFVVAIIRNGKEILLQAFNWESHKHDWWRNLDSKVSDIAKSGFTSAWLPPPSNFFAPEGYLPQNLYSPDSSYGSESMLKDLLHKMRQHKVRTMADIVINHRIRTTQGHGGRGKHVMKLYTSKHIWFSIQIYRYYNVQIQQRAERDAARLEQSRIVLALRLGNTKARTMKSLTKLELLWELYMMLPTLLQLILFMVQQHIHPEHIHPGRIAWGMRL
ncbi:hypothetical protein AgCh_038957 [Apium graveolens]